MKTLGITGGIGSGKSYVSALLREHFGIPVYDCDAEAKRLTASDAEIRQQLIQLVGPEVFDGTALNKQCLADFLFSSAENARQVNAIIHPVVLKDFERWKEQPPSQKEDGRTQHKGSLPPRGNCPLVAEQLGSASDGGQKVWRGAESAILFESGFNKMVDYVLFVDAPEEVRLRRAMQRDGATEQQIRARMQMQHPEQYRSQSDFIIDNSTPDDTRLLAQLREIVQRLIIDK